MKLNPPQGLLWVGVFDQADGGFFAKGVCVSAIGRRVDQQAGAEYFLVFGGERDRQYNHDERGGNERPEQGAFVPVVFAVSCHPQGQYSSHGFIPLNGGR